MRTKTVFKNNYGFNPELSKMDYSAGNVSAVIFGSLTGIWASFNEAPTLLRIDVNKLVELFGALQFGSFAFWVGTFLFLLKFASGALFGGIIGKAGGDLYIKAKDAYKSFREKKKLLKQKTKK